MRPFLYRCPNTGQNAQTSTANDADDDLCLTGGQPFGKPKPGKVRVPSETLMAQCNRNNFLLAQMRRATRISRNER